MTDNAESDVRRDAGRRRSVRTLVDPHSTRRAGVVILTVADMKPGRRARRALRAS